MVSTKYQENILRCANLNPDYQVYDVINHTKLKLTLRQNKIFYVFNHFYFYEELKKNKNVIIFFIFECTWTNLFFSYLCTTRSQRCSSNVA